MIGGSIGNAAPIAPDCTATPFARLFEMPMIADFLQSPFAIDFVFQPAQCAVDRFAFFKPDFGQLKFTSSLRSARLMARLHGEAADRGSGSGDSIGTRPDLSTVKNGRYHPESQLARNPRFW
jgi:hypothetical protein